MYPNFTGQDIAQLKTGQIVTVDGSRKVIASVDGYSAITTDGTPLTCHTVNALEVSQDFEPKLELTMACAELLDEHGLLEEVEEKIEAYNKGQR